MANGVQLHIFDIEIIPKLLMLLLTITILELWWLPTSYSPRDVNEYTTDTQFGDQTIHDNGQLEFVFSAGNKWRQLAMVQVVTGEILQADIKEKNVVL